MFICTLELTHKSSKTSYICNLLFWKVPHDLAPTYPSSFISNCILSSSRNRLFKYTLYLSQFPLLEIPFPTHFLLFKLYLFFKA